MPKDNLDIKITYDNKTPNSLQLYPYEFSLDAIDGMTFGIIPESTTAADFFADLEKIKTSYGGKILLLMPKSWPAQRIITNENFDDTKFLERIMYLKHPQQFLEKIATNQEKLQNLSPQFSFITDKNRLLEKANEISNLIIHNAEWAGKQDHKRRLYGVEAIKARIDNAHVAAIGILSQEKMIGFARVFIVDNYFGYFSDIVVAEQYRHHGLMTKIMQLIKYEAEQRGAQNLLLIAGTSRLIETYLRFGFDLAIEPVIIQDRVLFGCGVPPAGELKEYQEQFHIPPCPEKYL